MRLTGGWRSPLSLAPAGAGVVWTASSVRLAYRLAVIQWWATLAWGLWRLVSPSPNGFDNVVASVAWCWAGALVVAMWKRGE